MASVAPPVPTTRENFSSPLEILTERQRRRQGTPGNVASSQFDEPTKTGSESWEGWSLPSRTTMAGKAPSSGRLPTQLASKRTMSVPSFAGRMRRREMCHAPRRRCDKGMPSVLTETSYKVKAMAKTLRTTSNPMRDSAISIFDTSETEERIIPPLSARSNRGSTGMK